MKANPSHRSRAASPAVRAFSALAVTGLLAIHHGCTGGTKGDPDNRGAFLVTGISTGSGSVYPYRIRTTDSFGNPTSTVVNIESEATLKQFVNGSNGVLPVATLPTTAVLPNGDPGNHFLHFTFSHKLDPDSILSSLLADQSNSGLGGALTVLAYDPATETTITVPGRGFVNGITYFNEGGQLVRVQAVEADGNNVNVLDPRAAGFPSYPGAADLVSNKSFTFVADTDGNLQSLETFPDNRLLRLIVTNAVRDTENDILEQEVGVATTVGPDPNPPEVLGYTSIPQISPGNNQTGIDPTGSILVRFNKPVQPGEVGAFFEPSLFTPPTGGVSLQVTSAASTFPVIYYADPVSFGDLMNYIVRPAYNLPGNSQVDVTVQTTSINSLNGDLIGNLVTTSYSTGVGPGLVNAPVAPEVVYVGIGGAEPGVSVIDLHGFGQGTGDINNTRWPLNPNIGVPGVVPSMAPGTSNLDAGGAGVLTLTQDTNGSTRLLRDPIVSDVTDIHIGAPLDLIYNNENINRNASRSNQVNELLGLVQSGNTITQPPIPNPPRLVFPPPNPNRAIFGEEPAVKSSLGPTGALVTAGPPACAAVGLNLLLVGNPFSSVQNEIGTYGTNFMGVFVGPQPPPASPPPPPPFCPFTSRQQVGHFLYVLDRDNRQVVIVNSNRFTVLDTIQLSDPVSMAIAPNMTRLAVSNFASSSVTFIDIDPTSPNFHRVVGETRVDAGPTGVAWQPDGEDILCVSSEANQLTVISALDFTVRRTLGGFLNQPIDLVVTERYQATGNTSGVYYAYVLNSNGTIAIYESGPDGVNGIGFNDIIGSVTNVTFPRAQAMILDYNTALGGVMIGHTDETGLAQVSRLNLTSTPNGQQPLNPATGGFILPPTYRQKEWTVVQRIGGTPAPGSFVDLMSGNSIIDLAHDDLINFGAATGQASPFFGAAATTPYFHSGKHAIKTVNGAPSPAVQPRLLFVALSDVGNVDVFEINTGTRIATISVPGVRVVSNYWRQ
ncbi:MAG: hypothetical protein VXY92_00430 [Planctomycetota bacterium]|nr:hypothetical protein [Planctomycetota bacterium]